MEHDDKVRSMLDDLEASFIERRATRYVKKVKTGRAAMFIIALFNLVTVARGLEAYEQGSMRVNFAIAVAVFYFVLFIISLQRSYIPMLVATITYLLLGIYTIIAEKYMYKYIFDGALEGLQRMLFVIAMIVRLAVLYYLALGTVNAKKFEALYATAGEDEEEEDNVS